MDHKLKIFKTVAHTKSFTKAAKRLNLSQPAISKTIKSLEEHYGTALFNRQGNRISLTSDGHIFLQYTEKLLSLYQAMAEEFLPTEKALPSALQLGASTTMAHYVIPQLIAKLQETHPHITFNLLTGNTDFIQQRILAHQLDYGVVEGHNHNKRLAYENFIKDELVLVTTPQTAQKQAKPITIHKLSQLSFVRREQGSGTREVIDNALNQRGIKTLSEQAVFGSTESIKSYLQQSHCFAFLSIHALSRDLLAGRLQVVEIEDFEINRWFYFIKRQGYQSKTADKLKHFLQKAYNQKA